MQREGKGKSTGDFKGFLEASVEFKVGELFIEKCFSFERESCYQMATIFNLK